MLLEQVPSDKVKPDIEDAKAALIDNVSEPLLVIEILPAFVSPAKAMILLLLIDRKPWW